MARKLTDRQRQVFEFICEALREGNRPPTVREIAEHFGFRSPKAVTDHLAALERKGYIERRKGRIRLAPELARKRGIPIVGRVAAGVPIMAIENREGALSIDEFFGTDEDLFAVRAEGDSMVDAGILDGDWVIVRTAPRVESGEITVCYLGEEGDVTVKRLIDRPDCYELHPANEAHMPIRVPKDDPHFRIAGKVVGVVRRMQ